jgi:hypothetical protein
MEKVIGDPIAQEHALLLEDMRELKELNSNLVNNNQKQDVMCDETHNQLDNINNLLAEELKKRYELEEYVNNLKNQLTTVFTVSKLLRSCGWRGIYTE